MKTAEYLKTRVCLFALSLLAFPAMVFAADDSKLAEFPAGLLQISEVSTFSKYVIVVDKALRKLMVFERDGREIKKVEEQPADIGKSLGDKVKRDDSRTPEGIYFLQSKLTPPDISKDLYGSMAFTTNYPNVFDVLENKTGSGIWLHSIPDTVPLTRGSRGCVVVRNDVIQKISNFIKLKETPILIYDKVEYVTREELDKRRREIQSFVEKWRASWEANDLNTYMSNYSENFAAPGFNLKSWRLHKERLKQLYAFTKIHLSQPYLLVHGDKLIVKTLQKYESNMHIDYGIKVLYVKKNAKGYQIIREEWEAAPEQLVQAAAVGTSSSQLN
jgi:murein L,D-transpeptidase YafK